MSTARDIWNAVSASDIWEARHRDTHLWFCPSCYHYALRPRLWDHAQDHRLNGVIQCHDSGAFHVRDPHLLAALALGGLAAVAAYFGIEYSRDVESGLCFQVPDGVLDP